MRFKASVVTLSLLSTVYAANALELPVPPKSLPMNKASSWIDANLTSTVFQDAGLIDSHKVCITTLADMYTVDGSKDVNLKRFYDNVLSSNTLNAPARSFGELYNQCIRIVNSRTEANGQSLLEAAYEHIDSEYDDIQLDQWQFAKPEIDCKTTISSIEITPDGKFSPDGGFSEIANSNQVSKATDYCIEKVKDGNSRTLSYLSNILSSKIVDGEPIPSKINSDGQETHGLNFRNTDNYFIRQTTSDYVKYAENYAKPAINAKKRDAIDVVLEDDTIMVLPSDFEKVCPYKSDVNNALNGNEMSNLCKKARDSVSLNRMRYAYDRSNADALLKDYQLFGLTQPNGSFQRVNLKELIGGAAIDGLQIELVEDKGWFSTDWKAKIYAIDILNYEGGKTINAVLKPTKRADGVQTMQIVSIDSVDDLHGPSEVIECLTTPQNMFNNVAEVEFGLGILGTFFGVDQGAETLVNSYNTVTNSKICNEAKNTVLGTLKAG